MFYVVFGIANSVVNYLILSFSELISLVGEESNRKAMNRNWSNQKANPALKAKTGNKYLLQIDKIQ